MNVAENNAEKERTKTPRLKFEAFEEKIPKNSTNLSLMFSFENFQAVSQILPPRSHPLQKTSHEVIDQQDSQDLGERLTLPFVSCVILSTRTFSKSSNSHFFTDPQCCCSSHPFPPFEAILQILEALGFSQLFCRSLAGSQVEVISGFSKSSSCLCMAQHCFSMFRTGLKKKDPGVFSAKAKAYHVWSIEYWISLHGFNLFFFDGIVSHALNTSLSFASCPKLVRVEASSRWPHRPGMA